MGTCTWGVGRDSIRKCRPDKDDQCDIVATLDTNTGPAALVFNDNDGLLYAGFSPTLLRRCDPNVKDQCTTLSGLAAGDPDDFVGSLAVNQAKGAVFAGDSRAGVWKCPQGTDACESWGTLPSRF